MVDFTESFKKGIANADRSKREKAEIIQLFKTLKDQIHKATDGSIEVYLGNEEDQTLDRYHPNAKINSALKTQIMDSLRVRNSFDRIMGYPEIKDPVDLNQYDAILASSIVDGNRHTIRVIAEWKSSGGYPCKIFYDGIEREVFDKSSLEGALSDMISSPATGSIFQKLLSDVESS